jgi:hypothetical protein
MIGRVNDNETESRIYIFEKCAQVI